MDHLWQIEYLGPPEHDMLEAYTTLGYLAGKTERVKLPTMVTAVVYREPGLLAKAVTTLDVLSGGRAMLGIGAAWNEEDARGLGLFFPSTAKRFERLEEALQICLQMWSHNDGPHEGKNYRLARTLNSPQSLSRPHPPILIGSAGERKTLRLVARYADACNIFGTPELAHKLDVLREHCSREGRDYSEIEKTVQMRFNLGERGERVAETIEHLNQLAELGVQVAHGGLVDVASLRPLELMAEQIIPAVTDLWVDKRCLEDWAHANQSARGVGRRRPRHHHHHHGSGAEGPERSDPPSARRLCHGVPDLPPELRLHRHLLEQPPSHVPGGRARQQDRPVGQPPSAVLALALPLHDRVGGRDHLLVEGGSGLREALGHALTGKVSPVLVLSGFALAFVRPWLAEVVTGVAIIWLVPDRRVERHLAARESRSV